MSIQTKKTRPSISKTDKNWFSPEEISIMKKAEFDKGFEHFNQTRGKKFAENLWFVQTKATEFFELAIKDCEIEFKQIRLKPVSINSFELIFLMSDINFLSKESYKKVYECGLSFLDTIEEDMCLTFLYMPYTEDLNDNEFILNGFSFTYDPNRTLKS